MKRWETTLFIDLVFGPVSGVEAFKASLQIKDKCNIRSYPSDELIFLHQFANY